MAEVIAQIIAHRGSSHKEPENTLSAIKRAIALKVDCIEFDVHLSKDGVPVVIHDPTLCRTTNGTKGKAVRETLLDEIKTLDAGAWFRGTASDDRIPTLSEVLSLPLGNIQLMIEIKEDLNFDLSTIVMDLVQKHPHINSLIGSFSASTLENIQKHHPKQPIVGIAETHEEVQQLESLKLHRLAVDYQLFNDVYDQGKTFSHKNIWAFTVDEQEMAQKLVLKGIIGIITNHPEHIQAAIKSV